MSAISDRLEAQVARLARMQESRGGSSQLRYDREFGALFKLLQSRIGYLIGQYGLSDMRDDAEQVCAIAIHRALASYNPRKAQFTTHVTWLIRGELQSLRHRVRLDQRKSAQTAGIRTISLEALTMPDGDGAAQAAPFEIVDERAEEVMQSSVASAMARRSLARLMRRIGAPEFEQDIVWEGLSEARQQRGKSARSLSAEQRRQIVRRTYRNCAKLVAV